MFILKSSGKEDGVKEIIDKVSAEITAGGGTVETVQKMDKRAFSRVADKKNSTGFYVNVIFQNQPGTLAQLKHRLGMLEDVFRVTLITAPAPGTAAAVAAVAAAK